MHNKQFALSDAQFDKLADCLKVLASPLRLRLLMIVASGDWTVGEIARMAGVSPSMASINLRRMAERGCIKALKKANCVHYAVTEPALLGALRGWYE
jgi:ArsR family transcriptional regulator, zinc-responsive transcriptional repressor